MARTSTSSFGKFAGIFTICLALFFAATGVGVFLLFLAEDVGFAWIWLAIAVLCIPCVGFGIHLVRRAVREDKVFASGLSGEATIVELTQTGTGVGTATWDGGGGITPIFAITLQVTVPGHPAYQAKVREIVSPMRQMVLRPGLVVAIKADPAKLTRVVIDWDKGAGSMVSSGVGMPGLFQFQPGAGAPGFGMPGHGSPVVPGGGVPGLPSLSLTGTESSDAIRAKVREVGARAVATIDAVSPAGQAGDGRQIYLLGMWVQFEDQPPQRVDAPSAVEDRFQYKVTVGRTVPVRAALAGGAQLTVLCWDEA